jgi:hypothetical protein
VPKIISDPSEQPRLDWAALQACLEDRFPGNPVLNGEEATDKCFEGLSSPTEEAKAAIALKRRPLDNLRPPFPASIQDEIRLKNRLKRQWQVTKDPALKIRVNRLQKSITHWLNEWRNRQLSDALESLGKAPRPNKIPSGVL